MTKRFLIATVAALAIAAPAQAERGDRGDRGPRAEREQKGGVSKAAEAPRRQAEQRREARSEPRSQQRVERQRSQVERREARQRVERPRPQVQERSEARQRVERQRPQVQERRVARQQTERQQRRIERQRPQVQARRVARQQTERQRQRIERQRPQVQDRRSERVAQQRLRDQKRQASRFVPTDNRLSTDRRDDRLDSRSRQRFDRVERRAFAERRLQRPRVMVGERLRTSGRERQGWYGDYALSRYRSFYNATPEYRYRYNYDDGYLYRIAPSTNFVTAAYPLLGGAFSVGRPLPIGYDSYNVPYAYRSLYYDTPNHLYRYGDGAIYQVDPTTQLIQAVVALLTGQRFGIGQALPMGYDVYNVPYAYRDIYYDTDDAWYRYDDGYIYQVDPRTRLIRQMHPVQYGYVVGYPAPTYASYGYPGYGYSAGYGYGYGYPSYGVPYQYRSLYYGAPGYNYHYANGGIYRVDPTTQLVQALVALVTGRNFAVGQMLPAGYDAYNVPYQYRDMYYDTNDAWYRYDDGYIYQVDPHSLVVQSAIPVSYGLQVGHPLPGSYAGYAVPHAYGDLYHAQPGYDYRYSNGFIYQVDPTTRLVQSVAALVTGRNLAAGQLLPAGYDVYNVPFAYRDRYYDDDDYLYRYSDGYIYQVDPATRVIRDIIDVTA